MEALQEKLNKMAQDIESIKKTVDIIEERLETSCICSQKTVEYEPCPAPNTTPVQLSQGDSSFDSMVCPSPESAESEDMHASFSRCQIASPRKRHVVGVTSRHESPSKTNKGTDSCSSEADEGVAHYALSQRPRVLFPSHDLPPHAQDSSDIDTDVWEKIKEYKPDDYLFNGLHRTWLIWFISNYRHVGIFDSLPMAQSAVAKGVTDGLWPTGWTPDPEGENTLAYYIQNFIENNM